MCRMSCWCVGQPGSVCNAASVRKTNDTRKTLVLHPEDRCGKTIFKMPTLEFNEQECLSKCGEVDRDDSVTTNVITSCGARGCERSVLPRVAHDWIRLQEHTVGTTITAVSGRIFVIVRRQGTRKGSKQAKGGPSWLLDFYVGIPCVRCWQWRDNGTYIDRTLPDIAAQEFWMSSLSDWENLRRLAVLFLLMVKESCDDGYSQGSAEVRRTHSTSVTWQECIRRDLDT